MPIRIEDVVHLDEIKGTLTKSFDGIQTAFGELSFGFLTVIDAHNKLEARLDGEIATIKRALNLN